MWLACIPIVAFFAPLGSFVISKLPRKAIATFLYIILIVQFIGAMWVLRPSLQHIGFSAITLVTGIATFAYLANLKRPETKGSKM
jgi:hypothetical protein